MCFIFERQLCAEIGLESGRSAHFFHYFLAEAKLTPRRCNEALKLAIT